MGISSAGVKLFLHSVGNNATLEYMSANKLKVSVSMSPDMHEWLKAESARETQESGEDVSVSRLVVRAVKAMQGKGKSDVGAVIQPVFATSASGRSTDTKKRSRKTG